MKISLYVIISIISVFLLSCGSDDDVLPIIENSVEGTWELREVTMQGSGSASIALVPFPIPVTFAGNGTDYDMQLVFAEDPQVVTALGSFNLDVRVAAAGINMGNRTVPIIGSEAFNGTWSQENGDLVLTGNENEVRFQLLEVTPTSLVFEGNPNLRNFEFEEGGVSVNEANMRFVFDR
ncbi:hypothetical protein [Lunatibacter salilacus]|uniref:hypothetical protein n=1 Tax=Lunatibacter salilacus TaxID=2483804 RepID=UPI00131DC119|nr:hypothetical protein [Lunatibacter salilacus]